MVYNIYKNMFLQGFQLIYYHSVNVHMILHFIIHKTKKILVLSSLCLLYIIYQDFHMVFFCNVWFPFTSQHLNGLLYIVLVKKVVRPCIVQWLSLSTQCKKVLGSSFCRIRVFLCKVCMFFFLCLHGYSPTAPTFPHGSNPATLTDK